MTKKQLEQEVHDLNFENTLIKMRQDNQTDLRDIDYAFRGYSMGGGIDNLRYKLDSIFLRSFQR